MQNTLDILTIERPQPLTTALTTFQELRAIALQPLEFVLWEDPGDRTFINLPILQFLGEDL